LQRSHFIDLSKTQYRQTTTKSLKVSLYIFTVHVKVIKRLTKLIWSLFRALAKVKTFYSFTAKRSGPGRVSEHDHDYCLKC